MEIEQKYLIKDLFSKVDDQTIQELDGAELEFGGWVKANRFFGDVGFISVNDGSCFGSLQVVYNHPSKHHSLT